MNQHDLKNVYISTKCPYCGHETENLHEVQYEFIPSAIGPWWNHSYTLKERVKQVGLYATLFRKYDIVYLYVQCTSCGAIWSGDCALVQKGDYVDKSRPDDITKHKDFIGNIVWVLVLITMLIIPAIVFGYSIVDTITNTP